MMSIIPTPHKQNGILPQYNMFNNQQQTVYYPILIQNNTSQINENLTNKTIVKVKSNSLSDQISQSTNDSPQEMVSLEEKDTVDSISQLSKSSYSTDLNNINLNQENKIHSNQGPQNISNPIYSPQKLQKNNDSCIRQYSSLEKSQSVDRATIQNLNQNFNQSQNQNQALLNQEITQTINQSQQQVQLNEEAEDYYTKTKKEQIRKYQQKKSTHTTHLYYIDQTEQLFDFLGLDIEEYYQYINQKKQTSENVVQKKKMNPNTNNYNFLLQNQENQSKSHSPIQSNNNLNFVQKVDKNLQHPMPQLQQPQIIPHNSISPSQYSIPNQFIKNDQQFFYQQQNKEQMQQKQLQNYNYIPIQQQQQQQQLQMQQQQQQQIYYQQQQYSNQFYQQQYNNFQDFEYPNIDQNLISKRYIECRSLQTRFLNHAL
ncbi:hypothetical protein PPERSA_00583 [Pseudocohnilembus persalinus]|uniref:Uncharacterized protein n=1 Tax=Pseudocohnilembus persalinus TaxID=266149 RepID=A0A0V0QSI9_PSEPJ|nr:hypothetical protein PPERSA_00583 [Pseudocohnilembus persalinus]|eukprot:KRX05282.1 hypothetical protein PPERSA_00583 [Pseudocohnilembus persalinus]